MAAQTLTGLTASQATDGTYKVNFGFNAVDGDNDLLALVYEYKLSTASNWNAATTTAPASVTASGAGVAVSGAWDLDGDFEGNLQDVDFNFRVTSTKAATTAAGSLTAIAAAVGTGIEEGDTFTIGTETYEFVVTADPTKDSLGFAVELASAADSATLVKAAIIASITTNSEIVAATSGSGDVVTLTALLSGTAGNNAIVQSISNSATLTPVNLTGDAAPEVVAASVTVSSIDAGSADTIPGTVDEITTNKHDVEINVFEGTHSQKGFVAAGGFRHSRAKAAIEAIRSGKETIFTIFSDRAIGEGVAVLVNPTLYATLVGSATGIKVVEKNVHWLMNTAWRSFSQLFKPTITVYAIQVSEVAAKGDIVGLQVIKGTTVAYLISYADYLKLRN